MKSILDPSFRYTPAVKTDIRKTFARIRRQKREAEAAKERQPVHDVIRYIRRHNAH